MKDFTQGLLFGVIVGGLVTLLNTPRSGKENRVRLQEYIEDNTESFEVLNEDLVRLKASINRLTTEGLGVVNTATQEITASVEDFTAKNEPRIRRVTDRLTELTETVERETAKYEMPKA
ncbi:YtxH domain-containing protein [Jeotgalibaca sp. A122]|uniref:YtxH domain-containing protein n=1 Tax=Jeotgalibaca sp. A122 TaxID=3457322 RepID=UPI003FD66358